MENNESTLVLKIGQWLDFAIDLLYGLELLLLPAMLVETGGGTPA